MAKLKLIDTKDKFLLEIDGTEIPYVTSYQITRTVSEVVLLKLALSVADVESVEIVSDKITKKLWIAVMSICFRKMLQRLLELLRKTCVNRQRTNPKNWDSM